ncbi:hypothetical protein WMF30_01310 [Sorangium sp. So ce134]
MEAARIAHETIGRIRPANAIVLVGAAPATCSHRDEGGSDGDDLPKGATHVEVEAAELSLMLDGLDLSQAVRRKRWRPGVRNPDASKQGLMDARGLRIQRAS